MTIEQMKEAVAEVENAVTRARAARDDYRIDLAALDSKDAQAAWKDDYRSRRKHERQMERLGTLREAQKSIADTLAALDGEQGRWSRERLMRAARFAPPERPNMLLKKNPGGFGYQRDEKTELANEEHNRWAMMTEHLARLRYLMELPRRSAEELEAMAADAAARGEERDIALLAMIEDEAAQRQDATDRGRIKTAVMAARETIELPENYATAAEIFAKVEKAKRALDGVEHEILNGEKDWAQRAEEIEQGGADAVIQRMQQERTPEAQRKLEKAAKNRLAQEFAEQRVESEVANG